MLDGPLRSGSGPRPHGTPSKTSGCGLFATLEERKRDACTGMANPITASPSPSHPGDPTVTGHTTIPPSTANQTPAGLTSP
eukprot:jgi/Botrbrau1/5462/Bobra.27_1s0013.1